MAMARTTAANVARKKKLSTFWMACFSIWILTWKDVTHFKFIFPLFLFESQQEKKKRKLSHLVNRVICTLPQQHTLIYCRGDEQITSILPDTFDFIFKSQNFHAWKLSIPNFVKFWSVQRMHDLDSWTLSIICRSTKKMFHDPKSNDSENEV